MIIRNHPSKGGLKALAKGVLEEVIPTIPSDSKFRFQETAQESELKPYPSLKLLAKEYRKQLDGWRQKHGAKVTELAVERLKRRGAPKRSGTARTLAQSVDRLVKERDHCKLVSHGYEKRLAQLEGLMNSAIGRAAIKFDPKLAGSFTNARAKAELLRRFQEFDAFQWELVCALVQTDATFLAAVEDKANQFLGPVEKLAAKGDRNAIRVLVEISLRLVSTLDEVVKRNPSRVKAIAKCKPQWPVNIPASRDGPKRVGEAIIKQTKQIGLATAIKSPQLPRERLAKQLVRELFEFVDEQRAAVNVQAARQESGAGASDWVVFDFGELQKEAALLPPFSAKSFKAWWRVGRKFLADAYPRYWESPQFRFFLAATTTALGKGTTGGSKPKVRRNFDLKLREYFRTLSGENLRMTRKKRRRAAKSTP